MSEQIETVESPLTPPSETISSNETKQSTKTDSSAFFYLVAGVLILVAVIFVGVGLSTVYDNSYGAKIVGGDAYNFIIYATRGTAWICAGIVSSVLSVAFAVFGHTAKTNSR